MNSTDFIHRISASQLETKRLNHEMNQLHYGEHALSLLRLESFRLVFTLENVSQRRRINNKIQNKRKKEKLSGMISFSCLFG